MYFAIAYYIWPSITGHKIYSQKMALLQLWLLFIGMLILTLPWHVMGLMGQPRRIGAPPYGNEIAASWQPFELAMLVGGIILTVSAVMLVANLVLSHFGPQSDSVREVGFSETAEPLLKIPALLNGFGFWVGVIVVYLIASYGYPILQFFLMETHGTFPWSI